MALAGNTIPNYALVSLDPIQVAPRYRYTAVGERIDNITDWALKKFREAYASPPVVRPFGGLKAHHEGDGGAVLPSPLEGEGGLAPPGLASGKPEDRLRAKTDEGSAKLEHPSSDLPFDKLRVGHLLPQGEKMRSRAAATTPPRSASRIDDRDNGTIRLDTETQLCGIPPEAWAYRLGNRSGLDWILDQYKEKTPKDATIREKFNSYRFADYKEKVVDLIARVTRVSVETVAITEAMALQRRE